MIDWSEFGGWGVVLPPNRPGEVDMGRLKSLCAGLARNERACILGSTPEYRVVLDGHFDEVVVLDQSEDFKLLSDSICGGFQAEMFDNREWLAALPEYVNRFDLVVSHFTHGNISFDSRSEFFRSVANSLTSQGVFFDVVFNPPGELFEVAELEGEFSGRPPNLQTLNDLNAKGIFQGALIEEVGCIDSSKMFDWLLDESSDKYFAHLVRSTTAITPRGLRWDYAPNLPPSRLGYTEALEIRSCLPPRRGSAFERAVQTIVSSRRLG